MNSQGDDDLGTGTGDAERRLVRLHRTGGSHAYDGTDTVGDGSADDRLSIGVVAGVGEMTMGIDENGSVAGRFAGCVAGWVDSHPDPESSSRGRHLDAGEQDLGWRRRVAGREGGSPRGRAIEAWRALAAEQGPQSPGTLGDEGLRELGTHP